MEVLFLTVLLSVAVFFDVRDRKIPNSLIITGWLTAFAFHLIREGVAGAGMCVLTVVVTIVISFPLFRLRVIGAGDIKLLSVIGAVHDPGLLWQVVLVWITLAAAVSLVVMFRRQLVRERLYHIRYYLLVGRACGVPYYDKDRDGRQCTIVLVPVMVLAYLLVQIGRWRGFC